jgi:arylsulfatase A-like enzyme
MGYDSLRALRFSSLKRAGIIPRASVLPPRLASVKPWNTLTAEERKIESRKMELYAAMVDNLDEHVGRLIRFLKDEGFYDNTVIIFMSDNGAAAEDFYVQRPYADFIKRRYDNRYENMGSPTSFISYGPQWAKAGAAPFSHHKGYTTEGGIVAPLIIRGKNIGAVRPIRNDYVTVMDIAPTLLELAGVSYPGTRGSVKTHPMLGESMVNYLMGKRASVHDASYSVGLELAGRAYFRKGNWKIVNVEGPHRESTFQLFDVASDAGETTNLAERFPEKFRELMDGWRQFLKANDIRIAPENPSR